MKLKTAAVIETILNFTLSILFFPFGFVCILLKTLCYPFEKIIEWRYFINRWIGNKLLRNCDEVRDGIIKNQEVIRSRGAMWTFLKMKADEQKNRTI